MASLSTLLKMRAHFKSRITRSVANAQAIDVQTTFDEVEVRLEKLEETWRDFQANRVAIYEFAEDDGYVDPDGDFDSYEEKYFRARSLLKGSLRSRQIQGAVTETSEMAGEAVAQLASQQASFLREFSAMATRPGGPGREDDDLPKLSIETFAGSYRDWPTFRDSFVKGVHERTHLSNVQKFKYLRSLLRGEASSILANIPATDANYASAWERLTSRYDRPQLIVNSFIESFLRLPSATAQSSTSLRKLSDGANGVVRGLDAIKRTDRDAWIIHLLLQKVDTETSQEWARESVDRAKPSIDEFFKFLDARCDRLELYSQKSNTKPIFKHNTAKALFSTANPSRDAEGLCVKCKADHPLSRCQAFAVMNANNRRQFVREHLLCFNCLRPGHMGNKCRSQVRCTACSGRHHLLVHPEPSAGAVPSGRPTSVPANARAISSPGSTTLTTLIQPSLGSQRDNTYQCSQAEVAISHITGPFQGLIPTAVVNVLDIRGQLQRCRLILDSGSQVSLVTEALVRRLGVSRRNGRISVNGIASSSAGISHGICDLQLHSRVSTDKVTVSAFIFQNLTGNLPTHGFEIEEAFDSFQLADPSFNVTAPIDVLLGADHFWDVVTDQKLLDQSKNTIGQSSIFGWLITSSPLATPQRLTSLTTLVDIDATLKRFWEIEEVSTVEKPSEEHAAVERTFLTTTTRGSDGRYMVCLPFRQQEPTFQNTISGALARLKSVERRLAKDGTLRQQYIKFMREYEQLGHMRELSSKEIEPATAGKIYYLPHHPVIGKKLRVVFDGSFKDSVGSSLNDRLCIGPPIQRDLFSVCLRFRMHRYVFSADIVKMFRQIWVVGEHRDYQRIIWREDPNDPVKHFHLNTVTYGTSCAPFLSVRVLKQLALDYQQTYPVASRVLLEDFYVDDVLTGASTVEELLEIKSELIQLTSEAGLELSKWISNSRESVSEVSLEDVNMSFILEEGADSMAKVLGLLWKPSADLLVYSVRVRQTELPTKRIVLSDVARIFDPLGLIAPVVIQFKILFQQLWLHNLSWDEELPGEFAERWIAYRNDLVSLTSLTIPRYVLNSSTEMELHGFCDASEKAYAAVVYCRCWNGSTHQVSLVAAKTRVAPLKQISLPRLELCGAVLLARLISAVKSALRSEKFAVWAWCDSEIVLAWLSSPPTQLKTFVANRTSEILDAIPRSHWNHVRSKENPADCASRGCSARELTQSNLYWHGPEWLSMHDQNWQHLNRMDLLKIQNSTEALKETRRQAVVLETNITSATEIDNVFSKLVDRTSSFWTLVRITAFVHRFTNRCRYPHNKRFRGILSFSEKMDAKYFWLGRAQMDFRDEITALRDKRPLDKRSKLRTLSPFIDGDGLLRVGGRLMNAKHLPFSTQHPILLPKEHRVTYLILLDEHERYLHPGVSAMFTILRQKYWILGARNLIRRVTHRCMKCFRQRQNTSQQMMANLPSVRIQQSFPFSNTGCDYAGPIQLKLHPGRTSRNTKGYICLFVCLATKAIHLELVSDLTTEGFLAAFRRFIARRGKCSNVYSDNGTNFKGAARRLNEIDSRLSTMEHNQLVASNLLKEGIQWHFIPPLAPHFGGLWESGVRSVKLHLRRVIGNQILTFEQMNTLLTQVEAVINSRPICAIPDDQLDALTPSHFLIGRSYAALPEENLLEVPSNRLRYWTLIQQMLQGFWRRWHQEYLTSLQNRPKWQREESNLNVGDLVVVKTPNAPPSRWELGRITELHPGSDKLVRVITVRTSTGTKTRHIQQIARLPSY